MNACKDSPALIALVNAACTAWANNKASARETILFLSSASAPWVSPVWAASTLTAPTIAQIMVCAWATNARASHNRVGLELLVNSTSVVQAVVTSPISSAPVPRIGEESIVKPRLPVPEDVAPMASACLDQDRLPKLDSANASLNTLDPVAKRRLAPMVALDAVCATARVRANATLDTTRWTAVWC